MGQRAAVRRADGAHCETESEGDQVTVERSVTVATVVPSLESALSFALDRVDREGIMRPRIVVNPLTIFQSDDNAEGWENRGVERYEVSVSGEVAGG